MSINSISYINLQDNKSLSSKTGICSIKKISKEQPSDIFISSKSEEKSKKTNIKGLLAGIALGLTTLVSNCEAKEPINKPQVTSVKANKETKQNFIIPMAKPDISHSLSKEEFTDCLKTLALNPILRNSVNKDLYLLDNFCQGKPKSLVLAVPVNRNESCVNGLIDEPVYQGEYGDCWLVVGVLAMSYIEDGSETLQACIEPNDDLSADITFPYYDMTYTIPSEDIYADNPNYAKGDPDMRVIQRGVYNLTNEDDIETKFSLENGGNPYYVFKMFGAEKITVASTKEDIEQSFDYFEQNPDECAFTVGVVGKSICGLEKDHAYVGKSVQGDTVILIDPWDSEKEIERSKKELLKNSEHLSVVYGEF